MKRRTRQFTSRQALPWWLFAMAAPISYVTLDYIIPSFAIANPALLSFAHAAPYLAPVVGLLFSAVAVATALRSPWIFTKRRALLDRQTNIQSIRSLSWLQFEQLVGETYRRLGYCVSENPVKGADDGIDLWLTKDGGVVLVQCKHWKQNIGVSIVREHLGVVSAYKAQCGIIVSSGDFTASARDFAQQTGIELVSGEQLARRVRDTQSTTYTTGGGSETDPTPMPVIRSCPECGSDMVRRVARRGEHAGNSFWGCSNWPQCSGTRSIDRIIVDVERKK